MNVHIPQSSVHDELSKVTSLDELSELNDSFGNEIEAAGVQVEAFSIYEAREKEIASA